MPAFEEIGREFESATKPKSFLFLAQLVCSRKQIENGAPMDLFAAANVSYIDQLEQKGPDHSRTRRRSTLVAGSRCGRQAKVI